MNLTAIQQREYENLERLERRFLAGKVVGKEVDLLLKINKGKQIWVRQQIDVAMFVYDQAKNGKREKGFQKIGLLPRSTVPALPCEIEAETITCEKQNKVLTRGECLGYSGEAEHFEDCKECEVGLETKNLLCPESPMYQA